MSSTATITAPDTERREFVTISQAAEEARTTTLDLCEQVDAGNVESVWFNGLQLVSLADVLDLRPAPPRWWKVTPAPACASWCERGHGSDWHDGRLITCRKAFGDPKSDLQVYVQQGTWAEESEPGVVGHDEPHLWVDPLNVYSPTVEQARAHCSAISAALAFIGAL